VTVQLAVLKQISDAQEKLAKAVEDVSKYASSRADAVEKCKLPSSSQTQTTMTTKSDSQVEGTEPKNSHTDSSSTEDKATSTSKSTFAESKLRMDAVIACDVLYYSKVKNLFRTAMTEYVTALDFLEKNAMKVDAPRGSRDGGGSAYSSMY